MSGALESSLQFGDVTVASTSALSGVLAPVDDPLREHCQILQCRRVREPHFESRCKHPTDRRQASRGLHCTCYFCRSAACTCHPRSPAKPGSSSQWCPYPRILATCTASLPKPASCCNWRSCHTKSTPGPYRGNGRSRDEETK